LHNKNPFYRLDSAVAYMPLTLPSGRNPHWPLAGATLAVTKEKLLTYLSETQGVSPGDAAAELGISYAAAAMALLRLSRQGLVERFVDPDHGTFWYRLSARGRERLEYFRSAERHHAA
jgi:predicted ArsR family transcriptional regulator